MPVSIPRLRQWFAAAAIALTLVVVGTYLSARWRTRDALKAAPKALGINIKQTAQGFSISKSEAGRTLFVVRASKAVEFKQGGHTELHDVSITVYGRDSNRFDQVYGSDFEYDPQSGDVTAKGVVQIDLEANPAGTITPDQAPPKELKDPVHLRTSGLVFNQKTGNAYTHDKVEFNVPQARGSALGITYQAKGNVLTLVSAVEVEFGGQNPGRITAARGVITKEPRQVVLDHPHMARGTDTMESESATIYLSDNNLAQRLVASGNVQSQVSGPSQMKVAAEKAELLMDSKGRAPHSAVLSGHVQLDSAGPQPMHATAGSAVLEFSGRNRLDKVHAQDGVRLAQQSTPVRAAQRAPDSTTAPQDLEITAPAMDFFLTAGRRLARAQTQGDAQIVISQSTKNQRTVVTAGQFDARFGDRNQLVALHGAPAAKVVSSTPGQPDRASSSDALDVAFRPAGGIDSLVQHGNLAYVDGDRKAWADRARYTPADQLLVLTGLPRVLEGGMTTTARSMRFNRTTGDAVAEGDVKSTYSELKAQPAGALLASADPIHVTSQSMTAHRTPALAIYQGNARIWQNANVVAAPTIEFSRDTRSVVARGNGSLVATTLEQADRNGKLVPIAILASRLTYTDTERKVHLEGGVVAKGGDATMTSDVMDAFLLPRDQAVGNRGGQSAGQLDRILASGSVVIQQPNRRATGDTLTYTAADEKFVLSGNPASIFDAEHGKTAGDSLTFYRRDDRVQVKGKAETPALTITRVAR